MTSGFPINYTESMTFTAYSLQQIQGAILSALYKYIKFIFPPMIYCKCKLCFTVIFYFIFLKTPVLQRKNKMFSGIIICSQQWEIKKLQVINAFIKLSILCLLVCKLRKIIHSVRCSISEVYVKNFLKTDDIYQSYTLELQNKST